MKTRALILEGGGSRESVLGCGSKRSATPLSDNHDAEKRRRRCALPAQSKKSRIVGVALVFFAAITAAMAQYSIDWFTIDGGGGRSTNAQYAVTGTLGQHDAGGPMTNAQYSIRGGFWVMPVAVQQDTNVPALNIVPASPGFATVSWTPTVPGFVLQENLNFDTTNWVNSPSGATNPVVVPATVPRKFYRLFKL